MELSFESKHLNSTKFYNLFIGTFFLPFFLFVRLHVVPIVLTAASKRPSGRNTWLHLLASSLSIGTTDVKLILSEVTEISFCQGTKQPVCNSIVAMVTYLWCHLTLKFERSMAYTVCHAPVTL